MSAESRSESTPVRPAPNHRSLAQRLGLFASAAEVGRGLPLWLPDGTAVRDELEKLARELEFKAGFERVCTPHIARTELYRRSGHLPYFANDMYPVMVVEEEAAGDGQVASVKDAYVLRPMNCPHHHQVFAARPRSYRDLPLRLAEYGQVYRWERSGALSGLTRVRGMCMNDGHIYCTREQLESEITSVLDMHMAAYELLGIGDVRFRLSRRDPTDLRQKYVEDTLSWNWSEQLLASLLRDRGLDFDDGVGHAAFYGPKIDLQVAVPGGSRETLSTVQIDFAQPARLGLVYIDKHGKKSTPLCIHRAPFSTHERLVAVLAEIHAGKFPTWLAPVQVLVVPVSEHHVSYAREIVDRLRMKYVRASLCGSSETVAKRIRGAIERKIPNTLVVGQRECDARSVTLRQLGIERHTNLSLDAFEWRLLTAIQSRSGTPLAMASMTAA